MLLASEGAPVREKPVKAEASRIYNKQSPYKGVDDDLAALSIPGSVKNRVPTLDEWNQAQRIVVAKRMLTRGVSRRLIEPVLGLSTTALQDLVTEQGLGALSDRRVLFGPDTPFAAQPVSTAPTVPSSPSGSSGRPAAQTPWSPPPPPPPPSPPRLLSMHEIKTLVTEWVCGEDITVLAERLHRSDATLKRKARSIGLMGRQRDELVKEFKAAATIVPPAQSAPRMPGKKQPWGPPRTHVLCHLWTQGTPPDEIAKELGTSPSSVSTRAVRAGLPARKRGSDGKLFLEDKGYIKFDAVHNEYFYSLRSTATQSAWRTMRAG